MGKEVTLTTLYHDMVETQHQVNQNFALLIQVNSETKKELRTEMQTGFEMQKNEFEKVRAEMKEMKEELRGEMQEMREELRGEMQEMREELRGEMQEMKEELRTEMSQMKEDIYGAMKQMKTDIISEVGELFQETMRMISESQEKMFNNHEKRIARLEDENDLSHDVLCVREPDPPLYK